MTAYDLSHTAWRRSSWSGANGNCVEVAPLGRATWRKSTHSGQNGNCVEIAPLGAAAWHKSTHSGQRGNCVEIADNLLGVLAIRDSKNPDGPKLLFTPAAWRAFTTSVKSGDSDPGNLP
jgi:hypothetical protein